MLRCLFRPIHFSLHLVIYFFGLSPFLSRKELSGWLGNPDVTRKQWKVCDRFPIVSSSARAGPFMHSLNAWSLRMLLFGWNRKTEKCSTLHLPPLYRLDNSLYHFPTTVSSLLHELTTGCLWLSLQDTVNVNGFTQPFVNWPRLDWALNNWALTPTRTSKKNWTILVALYVHTHSFLSSFSYFRSFLAHPL